MKYWQDQMILRAPMYCIKETCMTFSKEFFSIYVQLIKNNIQYLVLYKLVALYFQRHFQHMNLAAEIFGKNPLEVSEAVVRRCSSNYVI